MPKLRTYTTSPLSAALISSRGSIDWLCLPRFDSPSLFARILDHNKGGHWSINPAGVFHAAHRYVENTNVLETIFTTTHGSIRLVDFMVIAQHGLEHEQPPMLVRLVESVDGEHDIE